MNSTNLYEETVKVASELFEKNGRVEGRDLENWLDAEKIVQAEKSINNDNNSYEETVRVASELYEKNGRAEGRDLENWLEAEKILKTEIHSNNHDSSEETSKVASLLYEKNGRAEGYDLENWLKAERILKEGEQFCEMFRQMLVQNPLSACKLMEAIKLLLELEQKQELERLIHSA